ncbi:hypothetical protein OIV83_001870 [Microbotryomycetes sp. JL201]|nr:hypothetical protein OIV83_001870 [Microbotryomycetes sp. JL201]
MDTCHMLITGPLNAETRSFIQRRLIEPEHAFTRVSVSQTASRTLASNADQPVQASESALTFIVQGVDASLKLRDIVNGTESQEGLATQLSHLHFTFADGSATRSPNQEVEVLVCDRPNNQTLSKPARKPFPLSNAAFENQTPKPAMSQPARRMSPMIEQAVRELKEREERERLAAQGVPDVPHVKSGSPGTARFHITKEELEQARAEYQRTLSAEEPAELAMSHSLSGSRDFDDGDFEPFDEAVTLTGRAMEERTNEVDTQNEEPQTARVGLSDGAATQSDNNTAKQIEVSNSEPINDGNRSTAYETRPSCSSELVEPAERNHNRDSKLPGTPTPHSQRLSPLPKSLRSVPIVPRPTKSSMLRTGGNAATTTPAKHRVPLSTAERAKLDSARRGSAVGMAGTPRQQSSNAPKIMPRQTKASALRTGQIPLQSPAMSRVASAPSTSTLPGRHHSQAPGMSRSKSTGNDGGAGTSVPGTPVSSIARPKIEPRMSRASLLRQGVDVKTAIQPRQSLPAGRTFEGVPGHPRRRSVAAAVPRKAPSITPRLNKSAMLRQNSIDGEAPEHKLKPTASLSLSVPRIKSQPSSALSNSSACAPSVSASTTTSTGVKESEVPVKSLRAATIVPRLNKSAELRKAQQSSQTGSIARNGSRGGAFAERSNER